jgi:hypothetical protein
MKPSGIALLFLACTLTAGCKDKQPAVLGSAPKQGPTVAVAQLKPGPARLLIHGSIVEKCPVAGCWFRLQDSTGVVKVDTKSAGFAVVDVPLGTEVTVTGRMASSGETRFVAKGLSYK